MIDLLTNFNTLFFNFFGYFLIYVLLPLSLVALFIKWLYRIL